MILVENNILLL